MDYGTNVQTAMMSSANDEDGSSSVQAIEYLKSQQQTPPPQQNPPQPPPAYIPAPSNIPSAVAMPPTMHHDIRASPSMDYAVNDEKMRMHTRLISNLHITPTTIVTVVLCIVLFHPRFVDATFWRLPDSLQTYDVYIRALIIGIISWIVSIYF